MRTSSPPLLPLFKSDGLVRLLDYLLSDGGEDSLPVTALARKLGLSPSTVQREVDALERAGIVRSTRLGRMRLVGINSESPFVDDLRALFDKAFGPRDVLATELGRLPGVVDAYIFGSWAERLYGKRGPAPVDIDLLLIGKPDSRSVHGAAAMASKRIGRDVQPTIVSEDEWLRADSGFIRTIKARPLVPLRDGAGSRIVPPGQGREHHVWYVLPHDERGWVVTKQNARRASAFAPTKREAVARARDFARKARGGEVRVARRDGRLSSRHHAS